MDGLFLGRWFDRLRANGIGFVEAVLYELLCGVYSVVDFDAVGLAVHGADEEGGDVFTASGLCQDRLL